MEQPCLIFQSWNKVSGNSSLNRISNQTPFHPILFAIMLLEILDLSILIESFYTWNTW